MDERHAVQPYHLPRQKPMNTAPQDNRQEDDLQEFLPREEPTEKDGEMKIHLDSLQIDRDKTPPSELVENASSTTRAKTRSAHRRSGKRAPAKRRKTSSSSESHEEPSTHRTMRYVSTAPTRNLRPRKSKTMAELNQGLEEASQEAFDEL